MNRHRLSFHRRDHGTVARASGRRTMVLVVGLNAFIGWPEHAIEPWQAEIAARAQN